jgi:hypothetical protein
MTSRSAIVAGGQLEFDLLLDDRQFWTFKAAAALLRVSDSFLEKLWDQGQIFGHNLSAGKGLRHLKRIPRASFVTLLVKTANYTSEGKVQAVASTFREFGTADLRTLIEAAGAELARKERA